MTNGTRAIAILIVGFLVGCALPVAPSSYQQNFVPKKDLVVLDLVKSGNSDFSRGRYVDAALSYYQALAYAPDADNIKESLAACFEKLGEYDEAFAILATLKRKVRADSSLNLAKARITAAQGRSIVAVNLYEEAYAEATYRGDTNSALVALRSLIALNFKIGRESDALACAGTAVNVSGAVEDTVRYVRLLNSVNKPSEALMVAEQFAANRGALRNPELLLQRTLSLYALRRDNEAQQLSQVLSGVEKPDPDTEQQANILAALLKVRMEGRSQESEQALLDQLSVAGPKIKTYSVYWPVVVVAGLMAEAKI